MARARYDDQEDHVWQGWGGWWAAAGVEARRCKFGLCAMAGADAVLIHASYLNATIQRQEDTTALAAMLRLGIGVGYRHAQLGPELTVGPATDRTLKGGIALGLTVAW